MIVLGFCVILSLSENSKSSKSWKSSQFDNAAQVSFDMLDLDQNLTLEIFKLLLVEYLLVDCPKLSQNSDKFRNSKYF